MANIEQDLQAIMDARYGKDVRQSIHDAIYDINEVNEANISTVQGIADTAQGYANTALQAKTDAQTAQTGAETAQTHAETAEDGAEHFYQETLAIAQALGSALIPRGTVEFANLPSVSSSEIKDGYMWNISDPFTTTTDFVEGAGLSIPMGANVYRITINNVPKWDILAGSSAQVYTGTEAQIAQAIQQGLLGEGVMINSLDDGEDELLTTSMIYHHNESLEDVIDDVDDDISEIKSDLTYKSVNGTGSTLSDSLASLKSVIDGLTDAQKLTSNLTFGGYRLDWSGNYCFGGIYLNNSGVTNIISVNINTGTAIFVTVATDGTVARVDHSADSTLATLMYAN